MTQRDLTQLHDFSLQSCDPSKLTDIKGIHIDRSQSIPQRINAFIDTVGNPYLFKVGSVVVKVNFNPGGKTFQNAMVDAMNSLLVE